jgi:serine/threonine protein kinase
LWKVITGKLGIPTPQDWPGCNKLRRWKDLTEKGLTSTNDSSLGIASKLEEFKGELRMSSMSPTEIDLALKLLCLDPKKRITAISALADKFFHGNVIVDGKLKADGAVASRSSLEPWTDLDKAHSEKKKRDAARQARRRGQVADDNVWKGSGGMDILGED